ncbi:cyclic nucleotide-binding domain-containing protein [Oscillatoria sp. FACHB-1406]|uniref:cyclic nucleotide-binding domain-containing protein n=1 Tax=Oscillatoria sp. FACHB-1406 TaxID=2692846 RepID=UPI0016883800|nr:cyclic nucleotide-binding domain-containing protein [Oscillatoria sp. FACHB-1406]MBD2577168.1 cyclic nucleotide-binding domain-containing protein [Oscillatoria sp. FACHB-1406]
MTPQDLVVWLQERTALSILAPEVLEAIARSLEERTFSPEQAILREGEPADGLYILASGKAESDKLPNNPEIARSVSLLPGCALNLQALLLQKPAQHTVICQDECRLWFLSAQNFQTLLGQYPSIGQMVAQNLAEEVAQLTSELANEQERQTILRPYLVTKARRGIVGKSRYATRLRKQIEEASGDRKSVLVFGEPGLEKDNIAALIHYGSRDRRQAIIKLNSGTLQANGADLFGRAGGKPGLLETLGKGTLVLNNIQELSPELRPAIAHLLETGTYQPVSRNEETDVGSKTCEARIILVSEQAIPKIDNLVAHNIPVPPLRTRKADIGDWVNYYLSIAARTKRIAKPHLSPEALRRLQTYDFPNNLRELENLVQRAVVQLESGNEITEEIIWPSQGKKHRFRLNLLEEYPKLRQFLRSPWWPDWINYGLTLWAFPLIVAILFLGPQTRDRNFALNLFWAWWWPLVLLFFPLLGRVWCAVCPFMIYGEVTQKLSLWLFPHKLKRWPRERAERWGGWFLFALFALILLWEELWNLENTAYLSAWLLLLITAGAMICSAIFERRLWCRYLCPIGGMNGMFAKLSMTELRAQQGICSAECTTYQCYKGGPQKGEGMETDGCPLYSHPAQLEDNRDCVLCMTCLKACPHRSVEFNLRPPGIELWTTHIPRSYEVALLLLLLNVVFLHHLPEVQHFLGLNLDLDRFLPHSLLAIAAISLPALIPLLAQAILKLSTKITQRDQLPSFIKLAYGYLPLILAGNLSHYFPLWLGESGKILPVALATFGLNGAQLPVLVAHPAVIAFLQGSTLIFGVLCSIFVTQKIARQQFLWMLPQHLAIGAIAASFWVLTIVNV